MKPSSKYEVANLGLYACRKHTERILRGSERERELRDSPRKSSNRYVDRYACRNWDTLGATALGKGRLKGVCPD